MKISVTRGDIAAAKADALAVAVFANAKLSAAATALDKKLKGALADAACDKDFKGNAGKTVLVPAGKLNAKRVVLVGLGAATKVDAAGVRDAYAAAAKASARAGYKSLAVAPVDGLKLDDAAFATAAAQGIVLAGYDPGLHKTKPAQKRPSLSRASLVTDGDPADLRPAAQRGQSLAEGTNYTRTLVNQPSNCLTPSMMADAARSLAKEYDTLKCTVWGEKEILKRGMGGLEGVGRGSEADSQFIQLEYKPKGAAKDLKKIAFVGKGITFDTGGISIKPAAGMELMKFDMGGAAAVIGSFKILAELQPNVHVLGFVAAAENMPSGRAIKPGDLLTMMSGLTVEVNNTDAEGRLVLADAIHHATQQKPEFIVDAATLTGACMIALGDVACGLMSEDDDLVAHIQAASEACGEPVWRLPLVDKHRKLMEGHVADLKNTGPREGGALTAAGFLSRFAEGTPWAHLDIAGTVWTEEDKPAFPKGATGYGAQLFASIAEAAAKG